MKNKFLPILLICLLLVTGCIFTGCDGGRKSYNVSTYSWNSNRGTVDVLDDTFLEGTSVTIKANPILTNNASIKSEFICWVHDNKVVSANSEYTFEVNLETSGKYFAVFTCPEIDLVAVDNFTFDNLIETEGELSVTNFKLSIGNSETSYQTVFTASEEDMLSSTIARTFDEFYAEDSFPYVFDKFEKICIKLEVTYLLGNYEYVSITEKSIPAVNFGESIEEFTFNLEKAKIQNSNQELTDSEINTFTINFTSLESFELESETINEE